MSGTDRALAPAGETVGQTEPDYYAFIARLAISYVKAGVADWEQAKDPHETDDDLEPTWVEFRDAVLKAAALLAHDS